MLAVLVVGLLSMLTDKPLINFSKDAKTVSGFVDYALSNEDVDSFAIFGEGAWEKASLEDRASALQHLLNLEAAYLRIEPLTLKVVKLNRFIVGSYRYDRGVAYIDYEHLRDGNPAEVIDTICHEAFHAYQHAVVDSLDFSDEVVQTSRYFHQARSWHDNFENYIPSSVCYYSYRLQPVEYDAFAYATIRAEFYMEQILAHHVIN